jgi:hypothetical protein
MNMPNDPPKYEGPFEDEESENAAYKRWKRLRDREEADKATAEAEAKKNKKKGGLPIVE